MVFTNKFKYLTIKQIEIMYNEKVECAHQEKSLEFAQEIAQKIIFDFNSEQQRQIIQRVTAIVNENYQERLKELENQREILNENYKTFLG